MDRALDLVGRIERDDPFLDEPDQQRRPEQPAIDRFILHRQMLPRQLRLAWLPTAKGGSFRQLVPINTGTSTFTVAGLVRSLVRKSMDMPKLPSLYKRGQVY